MRMYAFHAGGELALRSILDPFDVRCGETVYLPYFFYLIRHPYGDVIFDSGAHPALAHDPRGRLGAAADHFEMQLKSDDNVASQLQTVGIEVGSIRHAVQSHLHYDHAGGLALLSGALVYVQRRELAFARQPPVYQASSYVSDDFYGVRTWKEIDGDFDVFNDGRVLIFPTPGHTPGHQSLFVQLDDGAVILAGDAAFDAEKMRERILPGMLWNPDALVDSWKRIEDMQARYDASLILTHDVNWNRTVKVAPERWYQ